MITNYVKMPLKAVLNCFILSPYITGLKNELEKLRKTYQSQLFRIYKTATGHSLNEMEYKIEQMLFGKTEKQKTVIIITNVVAALRFFAIRVILSSFELVAMPEASGKFPS
jgi:hypothetical protein